MNKKSLLAVAVIAAVLMQMVTVSAVSDAPAADFFETAWQETAASQAYNFTCTISSSSPKAAANSLTGDQKRMVDLTLAALRKYKSITQGALLGEKHQLATSQTKFNTLGILDQMVAGQFNLEDAIKKMKGLTKKKGDIVIADNAVYFKSANGWKTFQDADFVTNLYNAASGSPFTVSLEKTSFIFKNYEKAGKSKTAVYNGTLTASETTSLLTPFISKVEAEKLSPAPTKLFITGDGHIKKYSVVDKVVVGGLSFTVKEQCDLKLKNTKIKIPSGAASMESDAGKQELVELLQSL